MAPATFGGGLDETTNHCCGRDDRAVQLTRQELAQLHVRSANIGAILAAKGAAMIVRTAPASSATLNTALMTAADQPRHSE
jgi:hypothetical protein